MTVSNISPEATGQITAKFYVEPSGAEGTKICSISPGHMTNMVTMTLDSKPLKVFFSGTIGLMALRMVRWCNGAG